jgi:hypothetical protein
MDVGMNFYQTSFVATSSPYVTRGSKYMDPFDQAIIRGERRRAAEPAAVAARYDEDRDRLVITLNTGVEFTFPRRHAQGLEAAKPADLDVIEISPSGFGLHFPKLDADLWLPVLLDGVFGTKRWMAARLGAQGGKAKSPAKARASRMNGKLGGRSRKAKPQIGAGSRKTKVRRTRSRPSVKRRT